MINYYTRIITRNKPSFFKSSRVTDENNTKNNIKKGDVGI